MNKVAVFENLNHLPKLRELWLNWNNLEDSDENKEYLKSLTKLETIYLADNPISQADSYQEMLTTLVPSLTQIDGNVLRKGMPFHHQRTVGIHSIVKKDIPPAAKQLLQEVIDKTESQQAKAGVGHQIGSTKEEINDVEMEENAEEKKD